MCMQEQKVQCIRPAVQVRTVNGRGYNGQQKNTLPVMLMDHADQFQRNAKASFHPNSTDSPCLQVAQEPRS